MLSDHSHFLDLAIEEAKKGLDEGGIPIGSVLVLASLSASCCSNSHCQVIDGQVVGRGHNKRVQNGSVILHAEMDCLENAGSMLVK
jgi:cytosine deaminase